MIMSLTRELGEKLDLEPLPKLEPIDSLPVRPTRHHWPKAVWDEMERIRNES